MLRKGAIVESQSNCRSQKSKKETMGWGGNREGNNSTNDLKREIDKTEASYRGVVNTEAGQERVNKQEGRLKFS